MQRWPLCDRMSRKMAHPNGTYLISFENFPSSANKCVPQILLLSTSANLPSGWKPLMACCLPRFFCQDWTTPNGAVKGWCFCLILGSAFKSPPQRGSPWLVWVGSLILSYTEFVTIVTNSSVYWFVCGLKRAPHPSWKLPGCLTPTQWSHSHSSITKLQTELCPHNNSFVEVLTPKALECTCVGREGLQEVIEWK